MDERKKLIFIVAAVFVWASSLLVWAGWWAHGQRVDSAASAAEHSGQAEADKGGAVSIPLYAEIPHDIHPLSPGTDVMAGVLSFVYEPLVEERVDGVTEGLLATDWAVIDDGNTINVQLREGVKWHDGQPFTAHDVVFTYHQLADPDYKGHYRGLVQAITGVKAVQSGEADTITGMEHTANTLTLHLDKPLSNPEELLQIPIVPRHIYGEAAGEMDTKRLIGTGPYEMLEREEKRTIRFARFDSYWNEQRPFLERVTFHVMSVEEAIAQFEQGSLDVLPQMDASASDTLLHSSSKPPLQRSGDAFHYIAFNPNEQLWQDKQLRNVIGQTLNKQQLVQQWLNGFGEKIDTPRGTQVQRADKEEHTWQKALEKLQQEKLNLHYTSEWVERDQLAEQLQQQWEEAGIGVDVVKHDSVRQLTAAIQSGEADLFLMTDWIRPQPDNLFSWWDGDDLQQWTRWPVKKVQSSLKEATNTGGKERERLIREWDELFVQEMPMVPLVRPKVLHFVADDLHGVAVDDFSPNRMDTSRWWVGTPSEPETK